MIVSALIVCLLAVPGGSGYAGLFAQQAKSPAAIPNPHRHARGDDVLSDVATEIKIIEAEVSSDSKRENVVENKAKTFRAFTTTSDEGIERIFFEDLRTNKIYEIAGVAWPNRPLNDPVCAGDYFVFDRSINPQRSMHYAFDLNKRVIMAGRVF